MRRLTIAGVIGLITALIAFIFSQWIESIISPTLGEVVETAAKDSPFEEQMKTTWFIFGILGFVGIIVTLYGIFKKYVL